MKWIQGFRKGKGSVLQLLFLPMTRRSMLHQAVLKEEEKDLNLSKRCNTLSICKPWLKTNLNTRKFNLWS